MFKKILVALGILLCLGSVWAFAQQANPADVGGRIVFRSDRTGFENLFIIELKTNRLDQLTHFPSALDIIALDISRWSLGGRKIAFTGMKRSRYPWWDIFIMDSDGSEASIDQLTYCSGSQYAFEPSWDPSDPNILYYNLVNPFSWAEIHRVNIITKQDVVIAHSPQMIQWYDISNDSQEILFAKSQGMFMNGSEYIGYQNIATGIERTIKPANGYRDLAGRVNRIDGWVLFAEYFGACWDVYKMDPSIIPASPVRLTWETSGDQRAPWAVWAKGNNEGYIVFESSYFGNREIVLMKAEGNQFPSGMINLTKSPGTDRFVDWTATEWNQVPTAACQELIRYADELCQGWAGAVEFDNGSFDPDGDSLTFTVSPEGPYPLGETIVTLTVTDEHGAKGICTTKITVKDDTPPVVSAISATPNSFWPPNHKMIPVVISVSANDNCDGPVSSQIIQVISNEPIDGLGDGDMSPDWKITGPLTLELRAERSGTGIGRVYAITVESRDPAGKSILSTVTVKVPKSQ